jgi:hypothetical protein
MRRLTMSALATLLSCGVAVAQPVFYPAKGQSAAKQNRDRAACQSWASQQTGAAPGAAPAASSPPRAGGRVRGAAAGATVAAITGNDAGKGAAAGAVGGAAAQRGARRQDRRHAAATQQQASASLDRALGACMQGRGYTGS